MSVGGSAASACARAEAKLRHVCDVRWGGGLGRSRRHMTRLTRPVRRRRSSRAVCVIPNSRSGHDRSIHDSRPPARRDAPRVPRTGTKNPSFRPHRKPSRRSTSLGSTVRRYAAGRAYAPVRAGLVARTDNTPHVPGSRDSGVGGAGGAAGDRGGARRVHVPRPVRPGCERAHAAGSGAAKPKRKLLRVRVPSCGFTGGTCALLKWNHIRIAVSLIREPRGRARAAALRPRRCRVP